MASTPVITQPANGSSGLGATPRLFGTADAWSSIRIYIADSNTQVGQGVTLGNGNWSADLRIPTGQWLIVTAQSYVDANNPATNSAWSPPFNIRG